MVLLGGENGHGGEEEWRFGWIGKWILGVGREDMGFLGG